MDKKTEEIIDTLRKGKMLKNKAVAFYVEQAVNTGDPEDLMVFLQDHPEIMGMAKRNIALIGFQEADNPFKPFPTREQAKKDLSGPLKLGFVNESDSVFGINYNVLCKPLINVGRPDSGKSQLIKFMIAQCLINKTDFNVLIPDLKKEYRHLASICKNLKVLTRDRIFINPLQVPSWCHPDTYLFALSETFISENYLAGTSLNLLIKTLQYLYRKRGIYDGSENYPTLIDLYNFISFQFEKTKSYKFGDILLWLQNRIVPYFFTPNFNCQLGIPFDTWRTENLVLEMDEGFTDNMYNFVVAHILHQLYMFNKAKNLTGRLRHLFNIDEARILFQPYRDKKDFGESIINKDVTKTRAYGIGYLVSSQETVSINDILRSLSFIKIAFPLTDELDLQFIQNSWGLSKEQKDYLFRLKPQRQAVVRYAGYEKPFLLGVPIFKIRKELSDKDVEERNSTFWTKLAQEVKTPQRTTLPEVSAEIGGSPDLKSEIPPSCGTILFYLSKHPFTRVGELSKSSGVNSTTEVTKSLKWLKENGYIEEEQYRTSRTKKSHYPVLQEKALKLLKMENLPGKGNFEHKLYQQLIIEKISGEGCKADKEKRAKGGSKLIDVLAYPNNEKEFVAYEVTLHFTNLTSNIQKDLGDGASKVVIVTRDKKDLEKTKKMVEEDRSLDQYSGKIFFETIDHFFS